MSILTVSHMDTIGFDMPALPTDMWNRILNYVVEKHDLKNVSLTSKEFHELVSAKLWASMRFWDMEENALPAVAHLPIQELYLEHSGVEDSHLSIIGKMLSIKKLNLNCNNDITVTGLSFLTELPKLEYLNLSQCTCDDSCLSAVGKMVNLRTLILRNNPEITDDGLSQMSGLTQLKSLDISGSRTRCKITPAGIACITHLPIEEFHFGMNGCTDSHLAVIVSMAHLVKLDVSGIFGNNSITDTGMQHLAALTRLEYLNISNGRCITSTGLEHIVCLPLRYLHFLDSNCNDAHLEVIARMCTLKKLLIRCNSCEDADGVTDFGLSHITALVGLEFLDLGECMNISKVGVSAIARPSLEIETLASLLPDLGDRYPVQCM